MKISVVVASSGVDAHSGEDRVPLLRHCLDRMLDAADGHPDFECLVVCDGNDPRVKQVVAGCDGRFTFDWVARQGVSSGGRQRNRGMARATGDLIVFIDDDDYWLPGSFAAMAHLATAHPGHLLVWCMRHRTGPTLWTDHHPAGAKAGTARAGHIGTPMLGVPNIPDLLGRWGKGRWSDGRFVTTTFAKPWPGVIWSRQVMAMVRASDDREPWE